MAEHVASGVSVLPPNPSPERGLKYNIVASPDGRHFIYGAGKTCVLRSVDDPNDVKVLTGHKKPPLAFAFTPDGKFVASGDESGVVKVWEVASLQEKKELMGLGGPIADMAFDHTGKRLAVAGDAKGTTSRVFMWESGTPQGELSGSSKRALTVSIRPDKPSFLAVGNEDMRVNIHKGPPYKFNSLFDEHKNFVQCVRYSPDGSMLATCSNDKKIFILDGESAQKKKELPQEHKGSIYIVSWSDDAKFLASCSADKSVKIWDVAGGKCVATASFGKTVEDMQVGCTFAGDKIISVSLRGTLSFIDPKSGDIISQLESFSGIPKKMCRDWSKDGKELLVGSDTGTVAAITREGNAALFEGTATEVTAMVAANGSLHMASLDDTLRTAAVGEGKYSFTSSVGIGAAARGIGCGPAQPGLVVVVTASEVILFKDGKAKDRKSLGGYQGTACAVSEDSTEVAVGGNDRAVHFFGISGDKLEAQDAKLEGMQDTISVITYSPTGKHIAVGDSKKEITLWNRETRENIIRNKWVFHQSVVNDIKFSPSGQHVATVSLDAQLIIWNVDKKMAKTRIPGAHPLGVNCVEWIDDTTVASGGDDSCIRIWTPKLP